MLIFDRKLNTLGSNVWNKIAYAKSNRNAVLKIPGYKITWTAKLPTSYPTEHYLCIYKSQKDRHKNLVVCVSNESGLKINSAYALFYPTTWNSKYNTFIVPLNYIDNTPLNINYAPLENSIYTMNKIIQNFPVTYPNVDSITYATLWWLATGRTGEPPQV